MIKMKMQLMSSAVELVAAQQRPAIAEQVARWRLAGVQHRQRRQPFACQQAAFRLAVAAFDLALAGKGAAMQLEVEFVVPARPIFVVVAGAAHEFVEPAGNQTRHGGHGRIHFCRQPRDFCPGPGQCL